MDIQIADEDDAAAISSLIIETAETQLRNEFSDDGWEMFLQLVSENMQKTLNDWYETT